MLTYIKVLQLPPVDVVRPLALDLGYFLQNQFEVMSVTLNMILYGEWNVT